MGMYMKDLDVYIVTMLERMNLRFAPSDPANAPGSDNYGGIAEMKWLQDNFGVFQPTRKFADSVALMNLTWLDNLPAKNRWRKLLQSLEKNASSLQGLNGDQAIVKTILDNLGRPNPAPVYFTYYLWPDDKPPGEVRVVIESDLQALTFLDQPYIKISIPMKPRPLMHPR